MKMQPEPTSDMTATATSLTASSKSKQYIDKPWLLPVQTTYQFVNANIVDPEQGQLLKNMTVVISNGKVLFVRAGSEQQHQVNGDLNFKTVDLRGKYLCPGLIDAHVHVTATPGEIGLKNTYKAISQSMNNYRTVFLCREMLHRGFTTARDCGGADGALKEAIAEWLIPGPRLLIAGHALSQTGGHGDQRDAHSDDDPTTKCCAGHKSGISRLCDGPQECMVAVRDEMRKGADFIKIMAGGGVSSKLNNLSHAQFLPEEISAIVRTAASFDTYVTAHAYSSRAIRHAIDHGALGIEHGNFLDEATAKYMAEKNVYLTPTLVTYNTLMIPPFDQYVTGDSSIKNQMVMRSGLNALRIAEEAGVTICYGSDLMAGMQKFQANEFSVRARVQSNLTILRGATINPARMMRMENLIGRIAEGFYADILILKENPLDDVTVLDNRENLCAVLKEGRVVTSSLQEIPVDTAKEPW